MQTCDLCSGRDIALMSVTPDGFRLAVEEGMSPPPDWQRLTLDAVKEVERTFERLRREASARRDDWRLCAICSRRVAETLRERHLPPGLEVFRRETDTDKP